MRELTAAERELLEKMIDSTNVSTVLSAVCDVCNDKAEHIRVNWQDKLTADAWRRAAANIDNVAEGTRWAYGL